MEPITILDRQPVDQNKWFLVRIMYMEKRKETTELELTYIPYSTFSNTDDSHKTRRAMQQKRIVKIFNSAKSCNNVTQE